MWVFREVSEIGYFSFQDTILAVETLLTDICIKFQENRTSMVLQKFPLWKTTPGLSEISPINSQVFFFNSPMSHYYFHLWLIKT